MTLLFDKAVTDGVLWSDPKTIATAIDRIATAHADKAIVLKFGSLAYDKGQQSKGNQAAPSIEPEWDMFAAKHYASGSNRKLPQDTARTNYVSGYNGLTLLGFQCKVYDTAYIFEYIMAPSQRRLLKGADKIGAYCRKVLDAYPVKAPTEAQLKALLPVKPARTAANAIDEIEEETVEAFGDDGDFVGICKDNPALDMLRLDMLAAITAFKAKVPRETVAAIDYKARADALRAKAQ